MSDDIFNVRDEIKSSSIDYTIYKLNKLDTTNLPSLESLPVSIRILLESLLRQCNEKEITRDDVINLASWKPQTEKRPSLPYRPARVVMQDFTGVPAVVDLAAMRSAVARMGGNPEKINPMVPVDLVIDHSVQVDFFATPDALKRNSELEFQRNRERYEFLHWGQKAFNNFRVVPPATGIVHQVNLEYLASVVLITRQGEKAVAYPDTLVGTDSHTTMINALGVLGWGVGGIEAEAAMLGQPIDMVTPDVIGFKLYGSLGEGVTATDLTLTITQMLRNRGVVEKFVEFYGPGLSSVPLPDRATISNMAPEYGATMGFFPVDDETLRYLRLSGRSAELVELVETYHKEQGLFRTENTADPVFTDTLELDLGTVEASLAGPKRPQDRISLKELKQSFRSALTAPVKERGFGLQESEINHKVAMNGNGSGVELSHGSVVIAAITSCTNTSNPSVMITAGLVAKKAKELGLNVKPFVKTSLAPGSRVVTDYLEIAGLLEAFASLGFNIVGYGCTTCIGNSGPLPVEVIKAITKADLVTAAVISGNRNFEGRVHPYVRANYLASPPLVVAYAIAGSMDFDFDCDPLGFDMERKPIFLKDIWPSNNEISDTVSKAVLPEMFAENYNNVFTGNETWNAIPVGEDELYRWDPDSTYIQEPPFFENLTREVPSIMKICEARALVVLGDSITTDHISPAGSFSPESPAGNHLVEKGVRARDFNSYGSRRGNDRVMTRGTFANIRLRNLLVPEVEGGVTIHLPENQIMSVYDAAMKYRDEGVPLIILAGKEYGTGSSRDWAAKGTKLLGVKAVIAESYERIHRSNLIGMGVLPLQFNPGENINTLDISGKELFSIEALDDNIEPGCQLEVHVDNGAGIRKSFFVTVRLDTKIEKTYYKNGGILHTVLRRLTTD